MVGDPATTRPRATKSNVPSPSFVPPVDGPPARPHHGVECRSLRAETLYRGDGGMEPQAVIERTRRWIASVVIGLNLCPFARRVFEADAIRYVVSDARDGGALLQELAAELGSLAAAPAALVE